MVANAMTTRPRNPPQSGADLVARSALLRERGETLAMGDELVEITTSDLGRRGFGDVVEELVEVALGFGSEPDRPAHASARRAASRLRTSSADAELAGSALTAS
jgi:hypothetical protein